MIATRIQSRAKATRIRHSIAQYYGAGILTCCPSTTLFSLALGPANPGVIVIAQETLDFRCVRISRTFWLLIPAFSLPCAPPAVARPASVHKERSPTTYLPKGGKFAASVLYLSPGTFSARNL